jgi:GTP-binding protein HflX
MRERAEESLAELEGLASAAGAQVVERVLQERPAPDPAYFIGRGKAEELATLAADRDLDVLLFDEELTPAQLRNLEHKAGCKILDRTQLILDIFAGRARTREGKLQVELAQLNYLLPRLAGKGTMLSRLGAGIGTRGPGETKLEMDRRRIRDRIALLRRDLEHVRAHRERQRSRRQGVPVPVVALVGYTNAGKSTLFNALTRAGTLESPQLFATLDPLLRRLVLPNGLEILLSDTVGFIRKLPHDLVAAFRATLEEVREADLLLHVIDVSSPHWREQAEAVRDVLRELEVEGKPSIDVYNKIDLLPPGQSLEPGAAPRGHVSVSALKKEGLRDVLARVSAELEGFTVRSLLRVPYRDARLLARLHEEGRIVSTVYENEAIRLEVDLPRSSLRHLRKYLAVR